jgi:uncharacterized protein YggE
MACVSMVYGVVYLDSLTIYQNRKTAYIGRADRGEHTISVTGMGKVTAANDIALTTLAYTNVDKDVATAQLNNKKVMDPLLAELKKMGIADADLQSNYNVNPEYTYNPNQELKGYRATNQVAVKIRDVSKIPAVLGLAGKYGANQIGGISYNIDDTENLKTQARTKAIADAKVKAVALARSLGVRLVSITNYGESEGDVPYPIMYGLAAKSDSMLGNSGGAPAAIASGSKDVLVNVNLSFEIAP